ncbi:unnamed protein product, partial [marine sediment metagenome]
MARSENARSAESGGSVTDGSRSSTEGSGSPNHGNGPSAEGGECPEEVRQRPDYRTLAVRGSATVLGEQGGDSGLTAAGLALHRTWRGAYHDRQPNNAPGGM